jgi:hypothetical protein
VAKQFAVTWDYRCPFARNAHEHILTALEAGADWDVRFVPFSLDQTHVAEGEPPVWDQPDRYRGLLANQVGIVVRNRLPDRFFAVHRAIFTARHVEARDTRERGVLADILTTSGVDAATDHEVWGVPTFIAGGRAAFVRLLDRPDGDAALATSTIERIVEMLSGWPALNEFKHTSLTQ